MNNLKDDGKEDFYCTPTYTQKVLESWRMKWKPTPVFLPVEFHGQRNLVGYSIWGLKELNITE